MSDACHLETVIIQTLQITLTAVRYIIKETYMQLDIITKRKKEF